MNLRSVIDQLEAMIDYEPVNDADLVEWYATQRACLLDMCTFLIEKELGELRELKQVISKFYREGVVL